MSKKRTYVLFWRGGNCEEVRGTSISEAFTLAGYSGGALGALDFYCEKGIEDNWVVQVDAEGKHGWSGLSIINQFPEQFERVDAPPPKRSDDKWNRDHYFKVIR